jgi:hypothetical protein
MEAIRKKMRAPKKYLTGSIKSKIKRVITLMLNINMPFKDIPSIRALIYLVGSIVAKPIKLLLTIAIDAPRRHIIVMEQYHAISSYKN